MRAKGTRHRSYAAAVDFLTKHPDKIEKAWEAPFENQGGSLFVFASPDGRRSSNNGDTFGTSGVCCLTQLKNRGRGDTIEGLPRRVGAKLLKELRADDRIPSDPANITAESLPAFAERQEQMDKAFGKCVK